MKIFEFVNKPSEIYGLGGISLLPKDLLLIEEDLTSDRIIEALGYIPANVDDAYIHPAKTWIDKTTLSGATIISNLIIDSLGHTTDWNTRELTPSDLGAVASSQISGTLNYIAKFTPNGNSLGDSQIFDNGSRVFIRTATSTDTTAPVVVSGRVAQEGVGTTNAFFGLNAGLLSDLGNTRAQTAFGSGAAQNVTTAQNFVAIGFSSARLASTAGNFIAIGAQAGDKQTTSNNWFAVGYQAALNSTATSIMALGNSAGLLNTTGTRWTAIGIGAGQSTTTAGFWTAIGDLAASNNNTGGNWTAIGLGAARLLVSGAAATSFSNGTYIGFDVRFIVIIKTHSSCC